MTQNYIGQVTTKAILKYKGGYILVRQEGEKKWILPGGRLDFGETPEACILREINEELSLDCRVDDIIGHDAYQGKEGKLPKLFIFYKVSIIGKQELKIDNEIAEYVIVKSREELEKYPMYKNQKEFLEKVIGYWG